KRKVPGQSPGLRVRLYWLPPPEPPEPPPLEPPLPPETSVFWPGLLVLLFSVLFSSLTVAAPVVAGGRRINAPWPIALEPASCFMSVVALTVLLGSPALVLASSPSARAGNVIKATIAA